MLSKENKRLLLGLARRSIEYYLDNRQKFEPDLGDIPYELCEDQGVFVTLNKKSGELRGCVGYIEPVKAIWMAVIENSVNAAFYDTRFRPLKREDLDNTIIEISILSPVTKLNYTDPKDLLNKLNKDMGLVIRKGLHSATFLPEVWKQIADKRDFLEQLCLKAGLRGDAWLNDKLEISYYTADIFKDSE